MSGKNVLIEILLKIQRELFSGYPVYSLTGNNNNNNLMICYN